MFKSHTPVPPAPCIWVSSRDSPMEREQKGCSHVQAHVVKDPMCSLGRDPSTETVEARQ